MDKIENLKQYWDMGWSIVPKLDGAKNPCIKWTPYQTVQPSWDKVLGWHNKWPDAGWCLITGKASNVVVVDCDDDDAIEVADLLDMTSPIQVHTKRGRHYYFKRPDDALNLDLRNATGYAPAERWVKCRTLDFRGDAGIVVLPPTKNYKWETNGNLISSMPVWKGYDPETDDITRGDDQEDVASSFGQLNLSNVTANMGGKKSDIVALMDKRLNDNGGEKITRGGSGINPATHTFISEKILALGWEDGQLEDSTRAFMDKYWVSPMPDNELRETMRSVILAEQRNHPERFRNGKYVPPHAPKIIQSKDDESNDDNHKPQPFKLIQPSDVESLLAEALDYEFWQTPWLPKNSIVQVYGYSGHGKSTFVNSALYHAAQGRTFAMFESEAEERPRVLSLDFEQGRSTVARQLQAFKESIGDAGENFQVWTPWLDRKSMDLKTSEGIMDLQYLIKQARPDIVVIDTLRSAFSGFEENSATEWGLINQLAISLRNQNITVILMHHSNKPNEAGIGREAGSSNQLTVLETQVRVTQVYEDEATAKHKGGIADSTTYSELMQRTAWGVCNLMAGRRRAKLQHVMEVRYGKVRDWTDYHEHVQYIGVGVDSLGKRIWVGNISPLQWARKWYGEGKDMDFICKRLGKPAPVIEGWLKPLKAAQAAARLAIQKS